jgi:hypothetical protein
LHLENLKIQILSFIRLLLGDKIPQGISESGANDASRRALCDITSGHTIIVQNQRDPRTLEALGDVMRSSIRCPWHDFNLVPCQDVIEGV